jgi:hypothetical protein
MLILTKMRKFRIFQFFITQMTAYNFWKQHKWAKFDMDFAFEWCINYHLWITKKFGQFLAQGGTLNKKVKKIRIFNGMEI